MYLLRKFRGRVDVDRIRIRQKKTGSNLVSLFSIYFYVVIHIGGHDLDQHVQPGTAGAPLRRVQDVRHRAGERTRRNRNRR